MKAAFLQINYNKIISTLLLVLFLCAVKSHADHFDLVSGPYDDEHCQLCLQNIDQPQDSIDFVLPDTGHYIFLVGSYESLRSSTNAFQVPLLRAPPQKSAN